MSNTTWASVFNDLAPYLDGAPDHALMSCHCVVSEQRAFESPNICPKCSTEGVSLICPLLPLRDIYKEILKRRSLEAPKHDLVDLVASALGVLPSYTSISSVLAPAIPGAVSSPGSAASAATAADSASPHNNCPTSGNSGSPTSQSHSITTTTNGTSSASSNNANMSSPPLESETSLSLVPSSWSLQKTISPLSVSPNPQRELHYLKCFPVHRKQYMHLTQPRTFLRSPKLSFISSISPDASKFVLASNNRWQLFEIPTDFNSPPVLLYSGIIFADYVQDHQQQQQQQKLYVSIADTFVMFAYDHHIVCYSTWDVPSKSEAMQPVYSYKSQFAVQCATASPRGSFVAHAILGRDKDQNQRPMIVLHCVDQQSIMSPTFHATTVTFTGPYDDPITTLTFSYDDAYLSCSTQVEQRFFVISVMKPNEPRLLVKSARRRLAAGSPDDASQGITSVKFFPGSNRLLVITSCSDTTDSPPIILDTKLAGKSLSTSSGQSDKLAGPYPQVVMRLDKVGTVIHNCEPSPRKDAVAFLDRSGLVYVMHAPNLASESRKIAVACDVAAASSFHESASMRFSPAGDVLFIVDRKGVCHIEDYAAALPHQAGVGKCRLLL